MIHTNRPFLNRTGIITFAVIYGVFSTWVPQASGAANANQRRNQPVQQNQRNVRAAQRTTPVTTPAPKPVKKKVSNWVSQNSSFFPVIVTNPGAPLESINDEPYSLPPTNNTGGGSAIGPIGSGTDPFPPGGTDPIPPSFPSGGGYYGNNTPQMTVATVPGEFSCPLFENNPLENMSRALAQMQQAAQSTPNSKCAQETEIYDDITSNSDKIKNAINQFRVYQKNPDMISELNTKDLERVLNDAVYGANNIATNFKNNPLLNPDCQQSKKRIQDVLFAVNDVLNNLSPLALVLASVNPTTAAVKVALLSTVVVTSTVAGFRNFFRDSGQLNMNLPENRKAVLQNTCQFMKIHQKIAFLNYQQDRKIEIIQKNLYSSMKKFRTRYQSVGSGFGSILRYKYNIEKAFAEIELRLAQDESQIHELETQLTPPNNENEKMFHTQKACLVGVRLAQTSRSDSETFPASVVRNFEAAQETITQNSTDVNNQFPGSINPPPSGNDQNPGAESGAGSGAGNEQNPPPSNPGDLPTFPAPTENWAPDVGSSSSQIGSSNSMSLPTDFSEGEDLYNIYRRNISDLKNYGKLMETRGSEVYKPCAETTTMLLQTLKKLNTYTLKLIGLDRTEIENQLLKNPEYRQWAVQFEKLRKEKQTLDPLVRLLQQLSSDNSSVIRTELQTQADQLKDTLFKSPITFGEAPVVSWLENQISSFETNLARFNDNMASLKKGAYRNTETGKISPYIRALLIGGSGDGLAMAGDYNKKVFSDLQQGETLASINLSSVPIGSERHRDACNQIQIAVGKYNSARDYLVAAQFMCDMISPIISDTSNKIIKTCRGAREFNAEKLSEIQKRMLRLTQKPRGANSKSVSDFRELLKQKEKELQCPAPTANFIR